MRKFLVVVLPVFALACSSATSDPGSGSSSGNEGTSSGANTSSSGNPSSNGGSSSGATSSSSSSSSGNTSSSSSSSGSTSSSGSSGNADAGFDAAAFSCGSPGDKGNENGVGKYCSGLTDCLGNSKAILCATLGEPGAHFCTFQCSGASDTSCGSQATCSCNGGQCGCTPNKCLN